MFEAVTVEERMREAGHKFANTLHLIASFVKKLQGLSDDKQGTRLYRGLGGLDVRDFIIGKGFTERAFMSSTKSLQVALEYSGIKTGHVGTVLAMEVSAVDNGAEVVEFSQFPGEKETVWNSCCYMQYLVGRDEMVQTECGTVRVLLVKTNANSRAQTTEELQDRRKNIVVNMLETVHTDMCRELDARTLSEAFRARLAQDRNQHKKDDFIVSIKEESAARVQVYKDKEGAWFAANARLGKAVTDGLTLSRLAMAKYELWLRDTELDLFACREYSFQRAYCKCLAARRQHLAAAEVRRRERERERVKRERVRGRERVRRRVRKR